MSIQFIFEPEELVRGDRPALDSLVFDGKRGKSTVWPVPPGVENAEEPTFVFEGVGGIVYGQTPAVSFFKPGARVWVLEIAVAAHGVVGFTEGIEQVAGGKDGVAGLQACDVAGDEDEIGVDGGEVASQAGDDVGHEGVQEAIVAVAVLVSAEVDIGQVDETPHQVVLRMVHATRV